MLVNSLTGFLDSLVYAAVYPLSILFFIFGVDDLLISFFLWWNDLKPARLSREEFLYINEQNEKRIGILVAAWHEAGVLSKMVRGNLSLIHYENYDFYLGVYPNDPQTLQEALQLQAEFSHVYVVINPRPGPTTKGQMLNELVKSILENESSLGKKYDGFLIHDSEDLIHTHSLKIMNWLLNDYDFVQVPVFSLPVKYRNLVAGTYIDEFAETHTRDLLVRSFLELPIPSAGVGTAFSRRLIQSYLSDQGGCLLNSNTVTEDYELGLSAGKHGLKSKFACYYMKNTSQSSHGKPEFIATREYFPKYWNRSVRQKTRWVLGVALQGWENLGWSGGLSNRYFLYRDRKGPLCNLVGGLGLGLFLISLIRASQSPIFFSGFSRSGIIISLLGANFAIMIHRIYVRFRSVHFIYGIRIALLSPLRFPISSAINAMASANAVFQYLMGRTLKRTIQWVKTEHEIPDDFSLGIRSEFKQESKVQINNKSNTK